MMQAGTLTLAVAAALIGGLSPAQSYATDQDAAAQAAAARRAVRDKETGKLRAPNPEELEEILAAEKEARRARGEAEPSMRSGPLFVREYGNGMKAAVLGPDYLVTIKAVRRSNGKLEVLHADPAMQHPTQASPRPTE